MIVFPMAGNSSRFREVGFDRPKYMLPLAGATCFDLAVCSLVSGLPDAQLIFVIPQATEIAEFVETRLRALGLNDARLVVLNKPTLGQAETAEMGISNLHSNDPEGLVIFNIDTFRRNFILPAEIDRGDAYLETFVAPGDHWSFVEDDGSGAGIVRSVVEKNRISNLCCTGLYQFSRLDDFRFALAAERRAPTMPELYVAPLYNHLIRSGRIVRYLTVPAENVALAGVPEEYLSLLYAWGNSLPHPPPNGEVDARTFVEIVWKPVPPVADSTRRRLHDDTPCSSTISSGSSTC